MNRIDRISAILIQLQSRRTVKASDIAGRFGISLRTVYRDVKTLEEAGVPVIGEAGIGYSLVDGYRLPPVMFTRDEVASFITAEKMVDKLTDDANGASYRSAMYKIKSVLRNTDKDYLESIDNRVEVLKSRRQKELKVNPLQDILKAIAEKRVLCITYKAAYKKDSTERCVEPIGVFFLENHWHLIAWCRLRQGHRDFRFDRFEDMYITNETFIQDHPPLKELMKNLYRETDLTSIVIRIHPDTAPFLGEEKYYHGFLSETITSSFIEMSFMAWSLEGFVRWFMMFADYATIIEPVALKDRVRSIVNKISDNL